MAKSNTLELIPRQATNRRRDRPTGICLEDSQFSFAERRKRGQFARVKSGRKPVRNRKISRSPGEWGVVLIDATPIRRKARRDYEKVLRDLDGAKAEAERFESEDKPGFEKWLRGNFGALLTDIRELQEKLFRAQELVNDVQQEFYYGNYRSINNAYKKVMHARAHPEEPQPEETDPEEPDFQKDFQENFARAAEEFWARLGVNPEELPGALHEPKRPELANRAKDLYRRLVRRLHPDKGGKRTAREIEWWHQTQDAYKTGNEEQLELILTLVEIEDKGSNEASVSVLTQLTAEFKKSLRSLKRKLTQLKRDVAWNFSGLADFSALFERTKAQLVAERNHILWLLQKYERQI